MLTRASQVRLFLVLLTILLIWMVVFSFVDPAEVVSAIGVENTYLIAFLMAAIGGLSAPTGTSFFGAVATFAAGGADIWLLVLAGGIGVFISDTVFYLIAQRGATVFSESAAPLSGWLKHKTRHWPKWAVLSGVFVYHGFTPFPNDILMIALVLSGYTYRTIAPVMLAGSFAIVAVAATIGERFLM